MTTREAATAAGLFVGATAGARAEGFYLAEKSDHCVDIAGGRMAEGAPIQPWPCHGRANQQIGYF